MDIPWSRMSLNRAHPSMELADPEFYETPGEKIALTFNPAKAETLFTGSGPTFPVPPGFGEDRKPPPRFPLFFSIKGPPRVENPSVETADIFTRLAGGDPQLKNGYIGDSS